MNKLIVNVLSKIVLKGLASLFGVYFSYFLIKDLGPTDSGVFFWFLSILIITSSFARLGFDQQIIRYYGINYKNLKNSGLLYITYIQVLIVAMIFLTFILLLYFVVQFVVTKNIDVEVYKYLFLNIVPYSFIFLNVNFFLGVRKVTLAIIFSNFIIQILVFVLYKLGVSKDVFFIYTIVNYFVFIISFAICTFYIRNFNIDFKEALNFKKHFNINFFLITATSISSNWIGLLLIGYILNKQDVALYNAAVKISFSMSLVLQTINQIMGSKFALYHKNGQIDKIKNLAKNSSMLCTIFTVPTGLLFIFFSSEILGFFDKSFESGTLVLLLLVLVQFANAVTGSVGTILQMINEEKFWRRKSIESFVLNTLLTLFLLFLTGINGAPLGQLIAISYLMISSFYYLKQKHGISSIFFIK